MEFKGSFNLRLVNRLKGEKMRSEFRMRMKIIYLGACCAYIAEVARQTPVLTGASRSALLWRVKELKDRASALNTAITKQLNIDQIGADITISMTNQKEAPGRVPKPFTPLKNLNGEETYSEREQWRDYLQMDGQSINSWMSNTFVPLIVNIGTGNAVSGRFTMFFSIKDFYLENYDAGTIEGSVWNEEFLEYIEMKHPGKKIRPYEWAWNLHLDGMKVFNTAFEQLMRASNVASMRNMLIGIPTDIAQYQKQVVSAGSVATISQVMIPALG